MADVIWSTSDPEIATVDQNGVVSFKSGGDCVVTVTTCDGGYTAQCKVNVVTNYDALQAQIDTYKSLELTETNYYPATWQAFQDAIAESQALIDANASSQKEVDAQLEKLIAAYKGLEKYTHINNVEIYLDGEEASNFYQYDVSLLTDGAYKDAKLDLNVRLYPNNANYASVTWTSSTDKIVISENGVASPAKNTSFNVLKNEGYYGKITCTVTDHFGQTWTDDVWVSFAYTPATGITISESAVSGSIGDTHQLTATVQPSGTLGVGKASISDFYWESDNENIATVDDKGLVTFVSTGATTVRAIAYDGGYTATCSVSTGGDRSALQAALEKYKDTDYQDYEYTVGITFKQAYEEAQSVMNDNTKTQDEINQAAQALIEAGAALEGHQVIKAQSVDVSYVGYSRNTAIGSYNQRTSGTIGDNDALTIDLSKNGYANTLHENNKLELSAAAIGGKDSMSGSFLDRDVPPTLISFAIAPLLEGELLTTDLKAVGHGVYLFAGKTPEQQTAAWERFTALARAGKVVSAWAVENGLAEAVMKMSFGNEIGFAAENTVLDWFAPMPGAIVAELSDEVSDAVRIGVTTAEKAIALGADSASIEELAALNDAVLEAVYPTKTRDSGTVESFSHETKTRVAPAVKQVRPKALIPVFPGTNCEYDTQRALSEAGADAEQFIVRNLTSADVADSVERFAAAVRTAQMIVIPGGFSGGDEPDGSAKLITAFFRNAAVREQVTALLEQRDGLMLGICNGFQALIKLGLVPYGRIMDTDESFPTLTYNVIGRHQSKLVRTRVCSTRSPWLAGTEVGDIYTVPISHGEGRFLASQELIEQLAANGQIATQYAGLDGYATMDTAFNPNGSVCAIEGITSPDGRVFGKMGHSERIGPALYRNVPGTYDMHLFASAVRYFKK